MVSSGMSDCGCYTSRSMFNMKDEAGGTIEYPMLVVHPCLHHIMFVQAEMGALAQALHRAQREHPYPEMGGESNA